MVLLHLLIWTLARALLVDSRTDYMANERWERMRKESPPDNFVSLEIADIAGSYVHLKITLKDVYRTPNYGYFTSVFVGTRENNEYWKVENTTLGGYNTVGGVWDVYVVFHQSISYDFIAIIQNQYFERFVKKPGKYPEYEYTMGYLYRNKTSDKVSLEKPKRPEVDWSNNNPIVTKVSDFNWDSDYIYAKVDMQFTVRNPLNEHYPNTFERIDHNSFQMMEKPAHADWYNYWTEIDRPVPANRTSRTKRTLVNTHTITLSLAAPAQLKLRVKAINMMGESESSNVFYIPPSPSTPHDLQVVKIDINKGYPNTRDITLEWSNSPVYFSNGIDDVQVYKNMFERREKDISRHPKRWGVWRWTSPKHVRVYRDFHGTGNGSYLNCFQFNWVQPKECQFRTKAMSLFGLSNSSNIVSLVRPKPPTKLTPLAVTETEGDPKVRNIKFTWENPPNVGANSIIKNHFEHREKTVVGGGSWGGAPSSPFDVDVTVYDLTKTLILTKMPSHISEFKVKAENYVGISDDSDIVIIKRPLNPTNLTVTLISLSEENTYRRGSTKPIRDFKFKFENPNFDKVNKMYQVKLVHRFAQDESLEVWGPWIDSVPINQTRDKDMRLSDVLLQQVHVEPSYPAIQFKMMIIGFLGESAGYSNIVTVERPQPMVRFNLRQVYLHTVKDPSEMPVRDFEFTMENPNYDKLNKVVKLVLQYRVSLDIYGNAGPWETMDPVDTPWNNTKETCKSFPLTFPKYDYLHVQFRVMAIGYVGTSDPSNIVTVKVPSRPRDINIIYYGAEINCYYKCELEIDWLIPEYNGTFEIMAYVVQYKKRSWRDKLSNWNDLMKIPENGLRHKRQFITFDNYNAYRVLAISIFGNSLPSNVLWAEPFESNRLEVTFYKDPDENNTIVIELEWDKFKDKKISYYIVQSILFFEHDIRAMKDEKLIFWKGPYRAKIQKEISFLPYTKENGMSSGMFLYEFRVITRYVNETLFGPTSCTTFVHFTEDELLEKGNSLRGYLPSYKTLPTPFPQPIDILGR